MSSTIRSKETMSPAMAHADAYHRWVFSSFSPYVSKGAVLEIGSGHGRYAKLLSPNVDTLIVSDIDPSAIEVLTGELSELPNVEFRIMSGVDRHVLGRTVDTVLMVNVLEHVEDDRQTLRASKEVLAPGGRLILFVPAFMLLYSKMDSEAGHFRRYARNDLVNKLEEAGFEIERIQYFNAVGFAGWLVNKWFGSTLAGQGTNTQITLFNRLVPVFRRLDSLIPFFGQSIVAVARPKATAP